MNSDTIKGNWKQMTGKIKAKWGRLTGDEIEQMEGHKDRLVGKIQEAYGRTRSEAQAEVDEFFNSNIKK